MNSTIRSMSIAAVAALLAAGCGGKSDAPAGPSTPAAEEKVLNVYNWSDYIDPGVVADFTRETGIKVNYDVFDANEVLETKLLAGNSGYDVVVPSAYFLERQVKAGVFAKLDKSKLPGLANLDPGLVASAERHDPGGEHSVVYLWGTTGIGYDAGKVRAIMPDAPVDSWALVFDPAVVSKFKDCGVSVLEDPTDMVGTMLVFLGKDPNSESEADLKLAEDRLLAIRPYIRQISSSQYIEGLANGDLCIAVGYSGDVPFLARLHPYREQPNSEVASIEFSLASLEFFPDPERRPCPLLEHVVGKGDVEPRLGLPALAGSEAL